MRAASRWPPAAGRPVLRALQLHAGADDAARAAMEAMEAIAADGVLACTAA